MTSSRADILTTPVRTDADLHRYWRTLMGPLGFSKRTLWVAVFDENNRPIPVLNPVDHIPLEPLRFVDRWRMFVTMVMDAGDAASAAVLLSRPGADGMTDRDRRWARALIGAHPGHGRRWPVHLATDVVLQVFSPDDLLGGTPRADGP